MSQAPDGIPPEPPSRVGDHYEVLEPMGRGGASRVFRARDRRDGSLWAVKILDARRCSAVMLRGFLRERDILARLDHPNVLRVRAQGEAEGSYYLVSELVSGGTLQDRLDREGRVPPSDAVRLALGVLAGLSAVHAVGCVHRDVKPENILILPEGQPVLADFGVARLADLSSGTGGTLVGTLGYMAPEQRANARDAGPASDIYGLGATLYAMVSGRSPMDLHAAAADSPRWLVLPAPLRAPIRAACHADPGQRPAPVGALAAMLSAALPLLPDATATPTATAQAATASSEPGARLSARLSAFPGAPPSRPPGLRINPWMLLMSGLIAISLVILTLFAMGCSSVSPQAGGRAADVRGLTFTGRAGSAKWPETLRPTDPEIACSCCCSRSPAPSPGPPAPTGSPWSTRARP